MEINDLKIFCEVANLGSISKAADSLGYVQSNISKRIAKLENEVQRKLFVRLNLGVKLTRDGERFLVYAKKISAVMNDLEEEFSTNEDIVRIGTTQSIAKNYLSEYFLKERVEIFVQPIDELIAKLKNNLLDFVMINREIADSAITLEQMIAEKIYWAKAKNVSIDFRKTKFVVSRDVNCPYRMATIEYLKENDLLSAPMIEVDTLDVLTEMIASGKVIGVLPEKTIRQYNQIESFQQIAFDVDVRVYKLPENKSTLILE